MDARWPKIVENVHRMLADRKYQVVERKGTTKKAETTAEEKKTKSRSATNRFSYLAPLPVYAQYDVTFPAGWPGVVKETTEHRDVKIGFAAVLGPNDCATFVMDAVENEKCNHVVLIGLSLRPQCYPIIDYMTQDTKSPFRHVVVELFDSFNLQYGPLTHVLNQCNRQELLSPRSSQRELKELNMAPELLKVTKKHDVVSRWFGAQLHQVFRITRKSWFNAETKDYRIVGQ